MNFIKCVLSVAVLAFVMCYTSDAMAQQQWGYRHYQPMYPVYRQYNYGYRPVVQWGFEGVNFNIGGARVSPNQRYIRLGVGINFNNYQGHSNYNLRNGRSQYYRRW